MGLKELLDKDVELVLDAKVIPTGSDRPSFSLEAEGHLSFNQASTYQDSTGFLAFDSIKYHIDRLHGKEMELENALVNKKYIITIGIKKK